MIKFLTEVDITNRHVIVTELYDSETVVIINNTNSTLLPKYLVLFATTKSNLTMDDIINHASACYSHGISGTRISIKKYLDEFYPELLIGRRAEFDSLYINFNAIMCDISLSDLTNHKNDYVAKSALMQIDELIKVLDD